MNIFVKIIIIGLTGIVLGCTPKYSAHFTHSHYDYSSREKDNNLQALINNSDEKNYLNENTTVSLDDLPDENKLDESVVFHGSERSQEVAKDNNGNSLHVSDELKNAFPVYSKEEGKKITKEEKRVLRKELKNVLRNKFAEDAASTDPVLLIILCFLLPPLAVYLVYDIGTEFWISVILTLLGWLPGVIYSLIVVLA